MGNALCISSKRHPRARFGSGQRAVPHPAEPRPELGRRGRRLFPITVAKGGSGQGFLQSQLARKLMPLSANHRRGARGLSGCGSEPTWRPQWDGGETAVADCSCSPAASCWCIYFGSGLGTVLSQAGRCSPSASSHSRPSGKKRDKSTGSAGH